MANLFLGFDTSHYPGSGLMQSIYESTNLLFCGFYLAPSPGHTTTSWMSPPGETPPQVAMAAVLRSQGWGLLPIYFGRQTADVPSLPSDAYNNLDSTGGAADAADAITLAKGAGLTDGVLFLDIETSTLQTDMTEYALAWIDSVDAAQYNPGIYAHGNYVGAILAQRPTVMPWVVKFSASAQPQFDPTTGALLPPGSDMSGSSINNALAWQFILDWQGPLQFTDVDGASQQIGNLDFNVSTAIDPSSPLTIIGNARGKRCQFVTNITTDVANVLSGQSFQLTMTIDGAAPWPNGTFIRLNAQPSDPNLPGDPVALPSHLRIPVGQMTTTISVATSAPSQQTQVTISAQALFQDFPVQVQVTLSGP